MDKLFLIQMVLDTTFLVTRIVESVLTLVYKPQNRIPTVWLFAILIEVRDVLGLYMWVLPLVMEVEIAI